MKINNLCISGASISRCPWITWVDFLINALKPKEITNHACKGAGNDYIFNSGMHAVHGKESPFLAVMLTNFDKYDMWVSGEKCQGLKNEKHPPHWIDGTVAVDQGFWCTGSHFPLIKKTYHDEFFDIGHNSSLNIQQALSLSKYCEHYKIPCMILFDSPLLQVSESHINNICKNNSSWSEDLDILQLPTVSPLIKILETIVVDTRGLLGFCIDNNLPWYNKLYGPHPPSSSHLAYYQSVIKPWLEKNFPNLVIHELDPEFSVMSEWMTNKWKKEAF